MTLVARINLGGAPFLIGDALLSSNRVSDPSVTGLECGLPLVGDINSLLAAKGRPFRADLCQKLHIFSGRLAVGWSANNRSEAERALRVLREAAKRPKLTLADIESELSAIDPDRIKTLGLVGVLLREVNGDQVHASVFTRNALTEDVAGFGEVQAVGSGAPSLIRMLTKNGPLPSAVANIAATLPIVGALLNHELTTGQSIDERWGGAFEAAGFSESSGRLEKLNNILHTFQGSILRATTMNCCCCAQRSTSPIKGASSGSGRTSFASCRRFFAA